MRINKAQIRQLRHKLVIRVAVIAKMSHSELLSDLSKTCGWKGENATTEEIRAQLLKWAVYDAIPDAMCE